MLTWASYGNAWGFDGLIELWWLKHLSIGLPPPIKVMDSSLGMEWNSFTKVINFITCFDFVM